MNTPSTIARELARARATARLCGRLLSQTGRGDPLYGSLVAELNFATARVARLEAARERVANQATSDLMTGHNEAAVLA